MSSDDGSSVAQPGCDALADWIIRRGLEVPAIFLLEAHKPLAGLVHGALTAFSPLTKLLAGPGNAAVLENLFESPSGLENLIARIEERVAAGRGGAGVQR